MLAASFSVSAAACLGSFPLIAHYFHLFTTINFLSNLIIVPLSSLAITVGFASFLTDLVWTPLAALLNNANYLFMKWMLAASRVFAAAPGAFVYIKAPPLWLTAGFYVVGGLFLCRTLWRRARRLRWGAVMAGSALAVGLAARNSEETVTVTALNIGSGSAIFLDLPGERHDALVDCGSARMAEVITKPFLRSEGCDRLGTIFLTHADASHVGGVGVILDAFRPRRIYDNGNTRWTRTADGYMPPYEALRLVAGGSVPLADGVEVRVLHPPAGKLPARGDDAVLVLQLRAGIHRILLMSDATAGVERRLIAERADLRSDVLIRGMPSRGDCCTEEFLDAVAAQWVVINCGDYSPEERPLPPMLLRIRQHGARLLRTDEDGAVTMRLTPDEIGVKSFSPGTPPVLGSARCEQPESATF
ncbi:MAG: ComEC/Rec2 family competence protein [Verrucomicrobia bacterium]|nr:ComEC/Rec2 family competence protein [Verrucomicrobiota bacterium]